MFWKALSSLFPYTPPNTVKSSLLNWKQKDIHLVSCQGTEGEKLHRNVEPQFKIKPKRFYSREVWEEKWDRRSHCHTRMKRLSHMRLHNNHAHDSLLLCFRRLVCPRTWFFKACYEIHEISEQTSLYTLRSKSFTFSSVGQACGEIEGNKPFSAEIIAQCVSQSRGQSWGSRSTHHWKRCDQLLVGQVAVSYVHRNGREKSDICCKLFFFF